MCPQIGVEEFDDRSPRFRQFKNIPDAAIYYQCFNVGVTLPFLCAIAAPTYPNDYLEELVPFIEFIGQRAHERAEVFFEALRGQVGAVPASVARLSDLVAGVSRACDGDDGRIRLVLSLLIASGRISQTTDPEMRALLGELERAGVLVRTRSTRRRAPVVYTISDRYSGTLQALRRLVEGEVHGQT